MLENKGNRDAVTKGRAKATERSDKDEAQVDPKTEKWLTASQIHTWESGQDILHKVKITKLLNHTTFDPEYAATSGQIIDKNHDTLVGLQTAMNTAQESAKGMTEEEEPLESPIANSYAYEETGFEPGQPHSRRFIQDSANQKVPC